MGKGMGMLKIPKGYLCNSLRAVGWGTRFVRIEARDCNYYCITCHVDNTGVKVATQVD